jgi:hypothetical protein
MADKAFVDFENVLSVRTLEETERNVVFLEAGRHEQQSGAKWAS